MYLWKCWRDTRMLFFVSVGAILIVMPISVRLLGSGLLTESAPSSVSSTLFLITSLMAIGLGALAASEQFGDNTVQFLYTKPRTRAYFVWVNWALGFAELSVAALVNLLVGWFVLVRYLKNPVRINFWELLDKQAIVGELIYCLLLYCLTYSLTAILRKGMYGLGATIISVSFLQAVAIILRARWQIHAPIPPESIAMLSPFVSKILWTMLGLLFIIGAQYVVERAEL